MPAFFPQCRPLAALALALTFTAAAPADDRIPLAKAKDGSNVDVGPVNPRPTFVVRIQPDRPDARYADGEYMRATVTSERDGYAYVFFRNVNGDWKTFFPNDKNPNNAIKAGVPLDVPGAGKAIQIHAPFGTELLKVLVSEKPLTEPEARQIGAKAVFSPIPKSALLKMFKGAAKAGARDAAPVNPAVNAANTGAALSDAILVDPKAGEGWAEHSVDIYTEGGKPNGKPNGKPEEKPRKVGVFIGLKEYKRFGRSGNEGDVPWLQVSDADAKQSAEAFKRHLGLDEALVVLNDEATQDRLEDLISKQLPGATRPGDLVVIYWSGHGGQCANTQAGDGSPYRQYLVPFDGDLNAPEKTMVLDQTFARWVQALDGRKVLVVCDTCHSGGQVADPQKRAKTATPRGAAKGGLSARRPRYFLDLEVDRLAKKIRQKDVFVVASSQADEPSFERRQQDLSVMTYYVLDRLAKPGRLTAMDLYDAVKAEVPAYVRSTFPGATQTPVYGGSLTHPPYLRD